VIRAVRAVSIVLCEKNGSQTGTLAENGLKARTLTLHGFPFDSSAGDTRESAVGTYFLADPHVALVAVPKTRSQGSPERDA
jgi:hypothetical protein